ncbi:peptidylprolyl isomerase [candidate division WWE3 bacterium]|uniref:Peptidyl-prolyl cis-trans isomerase n=1 Tax=candidate division WWE3 bacterium TaxID=2053526 RepID=A0A955LH11_UNCKA|nr:peptidylprolyl isomerase [candidate division WWE3 bacterium]
MILEEGKDYQAVLHTNKGDIIIDLHEKDTPITVNNFVFLAEQGFYKNVPFHRVIKGFMIQSGDPTGTGTGSPGYRFEDEDFTGEYMRGSVAMANSGPDTNGSQFFIMHEDSNTLPHNYVIFGKVIEGLDVVDAIADVPVKQSRTGELSAPAIEVLISDISIETI